MNDKRKGARSFKDLDYNIINRLNKGEIESVNLTEWLAVDQILLLQSFLKHIKREHYFEAISSEIDKLKKQSSNILIQTIGYNFRLLIKKHSDSELLPLMNSHISDIIRCWAAHIIGSDEELSISEKLIKIKPFASDSHFGVREEAWMAVRSSIIEDLNNSIKILATWVSSANEYLRRFATESTRPRGVWCQHIEVLKQNPGLALDILDPLKSDSSKYVRDSIGNWLNDASKTQPLFVKKICNNELAPKSWTDK